MDQDMYVEKQLKPVDKAPATPAEEKEAIANKFVDDAYQCGCGQVSSGVDKDAWANKGNWVDKESAVDAESYIIQKKLLAAKQQPMSDKDDVWFDKQSCTGDQKVFPAEKLSTGEKETFFKDKLATGDKDTYLKDKLSLDGKEIYSKDKSCISDKNSKCGDDVYAGGKVTPEEYAEFQRELQRQELLSKKISLALRSGTFGDQETETAIADNFKVLAKNGGRQGEQQLLDKINAGLKADASDYRLRFGQNHIKTPGGRRLEIVDGSGRVTDHMDFVVPDFHGGKDAGVIQKQTNVNKELDSHSTGIRKQINPAKGNFSKTN